MSNDKPITTAPFSVKPQRYVSYVMSKWMGRNWAWVALPALVSFALTAVSIAWLYVALMIVFLVYPTLMMFTYFKYALTPEATNVVYTQIITFTAMTVERHFIVDDRFKTVPADQVVAGKDIKSVVLADKNIVLSFKDSAYAFWILPLEALDPNDVDRIIGINFA